MNEDIERLLNMIDGFGKKENEPEEAPEEVPFEETPVYIVLSDEAYFIEWHSGVPVIGDFDRAMRFQSVDMAADVAKNLGPGWMVLEWYGDEA